MYLDEQCDAIRSSEDMHSSTREEGAVTTGEYCGACATYSKSFFCCAENHFLKSSGDLRDATSWANWAMRLQAACCVSANPLKRSSWMASSKMSMAVVLVPVVRVQRSA